MRLAELVLGVVGEVCVSTPVSLGRAALGLAEGICWSWGLGQSIKCGSEVRQGWFVGSTGGVGRDKGRL